MSDAVVVRDEPDNRRLVTEVDGVEAVLEYRARPGRLVIVHTEVPEAIGGRGIAGRLVAAAVAKAIEEERTVAPWCPYARRWLEGHPAEIAGIEVDWAPPPEA